MQFSAAAPARAGGDGAALPVVTFRGLHGDFGPGAREAWGEEGVALPLVFSDPPNACTSELRGWGGRPVAGSVLLVERGDCYFSTKVQHAHAAGARAAVIFNDDKSGAGFYKVRRRPVRCARVRAGTHRLLATARHVAERARRRSSHSPRHRRQALGSP